MATSDGTTDATRPARRRGALVAAVAVVVGAALLLPRLVGAAERADAADGAAQQDAVRCSLWAMAVPTVPVAAEGEPVEVGGALEAGTARCEDPRGEISGVRYEMAEEARVLATCSRLEVADAEVAVEWVLADGSTQRSTLRIGRLTVDGTGPALADAVVEGGPAAVAGKPVAVSADQETIDAAKAAAATQCTTGGVKSLVGTVEVRFG
ncbi:hypothetical protein [Saccharothrix algeriensis]|uniref:Uncharacterized protein n=1 Tax=Saccharothrix algeriensis TaxID=173560 RepID=A0A8T8I2J4_9PSEU|nr:hypothetical protein [Saccharothrix algeriensis]MBM7809969.1 hypothetical protein [Saccharothrix algeriensis]QTR04214.1 hypothetical protein J7S33_04460 [Saccharothrix algeriensis]